MKYLGYWSTYGTTYEYTSTIIKTDSEGNLQWVENYSSSLDLLPSPPPTLGNASTKIKTSDGGLAYENSGNIVKTDSNGNEQWVKYLTFPSFGTTPLPLELLPPLLRRQMAQLQVWGLEILRLASMTVMVLFIW